jgi:hypothetical protein
MTCDSRALIVIKIKQDAVKVINLSLPIRSWSVEDVASMPKTSKTKCIQVTFGVTKEILYGTYVCQAGFKKPLRF